MTHDLRRKVELGMAFWIGVGLMSIIDVWKITQQRSPLLYSWIMFGVSAVLIVAGIILLLTIKGSKK